MQQNLQNKIEIEKYLKSIKTRVNIAKNNYEKYSSLTGDFDSLVLDALSFYEKFFPLYYNFKKTYYFLRNLIFYLQ